MIIVFPDLVIDVPPCDSIVKVKENSGGVPPIVLKVSVDMVKVRQLMLVLGIGQE